VAVAMLLPLHALGFDVIGVKKLIGVKMIVIKNDSSVTPLLRDHVV
jgi:hypothetical protein